MLKRIAFITMGGTISALGSNRLDLKDYISGKISGEMILDHLPELKEMVQLETYNLDKISSTQINADHWYFLKKKIDEFIHLKNFDGVVISHGTNTLEETAYYLQLTMNTNIPIVLVGAQRPFNALGSDAQLNVFNAIRVAIDDASLGKGVLVAMNDYIHSAREVTKINTYRLDTFKSNPIGVLGTIDVDSSINYYRESTKLHTLISDLKDIEYKELASIEIVYSYAGATGDVIDFITDSGKYKGIVIAGTGAGRFSKLEEEALLRAREKGLYVVRSSRCIEGRVVEIDPFKHLDAIVADDLTPQKARILLMLALQKYKKVSEIQDVFNTH